MLFSLSGAAGLARQRFSSVIGVGGLRGAGNSSTGLKRIASPALYRHYASFHSENDALSIQSNKNTAFDAGVDPEEILKFSSVCEEWWDPNGSFRPLHSLNLCRIEYFRNWIENHFILERDQSTPFSNMKMLDVGCGGGLLSESLTALGGDVLGIDASWENIRVANLHKSTSTMNLNTLKYEAVTAESLVKEGVVEAFDVIFASEVIEHVVNPLTFVQTLGKLLKPGGLLFMSTMNRTPKAFALTIAAAEYVFKIVPKGTHEYSKYVTPGEMVLAVESCNQDDGKGPQMNVECFQGVYLNPFTNQWHLCDSTDVNYFVVVSKSPSMAPSATI
eukprot:Nk52_evm62s1444 gene=Nk52_evmTU62s1444